MSRNIFIYDENFSEYFSFKKPIFHNQDINYQDEKGWCVLFESIALNKNIEVIISLNADINIRDNKGRNALYWAIYYKNIDAVKLLINKGINLYVTPTLYAVHYAVYNDDVKMLKCLKSCGVDIINFLDEINATAFIYAVLYNKIHSIDYLLKNGADINQPDVLGNSAYSLAKDLKIDNILKKFNKN
ncbi:hypothetical protein CPU12_02245 [Malaciobacter molluscorum LMG 25693]|uniref:Ankyrin domain-containing protein n=1 Tax=Malaciobacter molluscorum LMG 25693 TaxID=870501 RepID=A0A2G1DKS1_9BACT|nr:ankyrin repeat domain-containing protein [Malaciobacter molluscorum]AXX92667.1 ankyrin domain-containing protein [Malaciobacter molluscorum LMG 25693]PHO19088.1 hypothetical protein CPU12_02245 [Malaciobacter molluscorum LMG 25693]RXJ97394.1 hypothetical protein CRV00_00730 [Malaciobacter molluscorum]